MKGIRILNAVLASALTAGALVLVAAPAPGLTAKDATPKNSAMIVTANLAEAWSYSDARKHGDMAQFVKRLLDDFRYRPDILALQEVRKISATFVAKELSRLTKKDYRIVVMPPANPYFPMPGRAGAKETSIVANMDTMKVLHKGGYFPLYADKAHEVEPNDPVFHQAYALLERRATGEKYATMSVHTLPPGYLATEDLDRSYRNKWVGQMHRLLYRKYGGRRNLNYLLVGDFNQGTCQRHAPGWKCYKYERFATTLKKKGYTDTAKRHGAVDLIWSKGKPGALHVADSANVGYSDHPFRWTILGPDTYAPLPPKPLLTDLLRRPDGGPKVNVSWNKLGDDRGGSGVVKMELYRKLNDDQWTEIKQSDWNGDARYYDNDLDWSDDTASYRVRSLDKAGNYSRYAKRKVVVERS